jgi:hypothetical protein
MIAELLDKAKQQHVFFLGPLVSLDVWIDLMPPALGALLTSFAGYVARNFRPFVPNTLLPGIQKLVLFLRPDACSVGDGRQRIRGNHIGRRLGLGALALLILV